MTQPRQIGVAVVGSGRIGTLRAHMAARHPSVRFLAVSDKDPERAGTLGRAVGAQLASGNNLDVIAHPEVDAVIVSTSEHEDADRVVAAADRKGVDIRVGYSRRHDRRWMLAKEQIREGRLGQILGATARVYNSRAQMFEILKRSPHATPITDVLTYYVDMACWFLEGNRPVEVVARGQSKIFRELGYEAQDVTWTILTFEDGAVVNLGVCYVLPAQYPTYGQSARFEVLGTEGVILLDMDNKDSVLFTDQGVPHAYVPGHAAKMLFMQSNSSGDWAMGDYWGPIANETRSWLDHLLTGRPCPHTTAREGRLTLEVTLAIEHSTRTGEAVKLPFHGTHS